jgi:hypothetical protein
VARCACSTCHCRRPANTRATTPPVPAPHTQGETDQVELLARGARMGRGDQQQRGQPGQHHDRDQHDRRDPPPRLRPGPPPPRRPISRLGLCHRHTFTEGVDQRVCRHGVVQKLSPTAGRRDHPRLYIRRPALTPSSDEFVEEGRGGAGGAQADQHRFR